MSKNTDIVEIINNNFRDISSINISELSLAVASPSRKAIEHRYFQMECVHDNENKKFFLKNILEESEQLLQFEKISKNYKSIELKDTANLFSVLNKEKFIILDYLEDYKTANLRQLRDKNNITKILNFKKNLSKLKSLDNSENVFSNIEKYINYIDNKKLPKFHKFEFFTNSFYLIKEKLQDIDKDLVPCHVDNSASNFMINKNNEIKVIDLDFCSNNDPLSDLGSFVAEVCLFKNEINPIIEEYYGVYKQNLANRCFMYSILDDLKWAIYNFIYSKISKRSHIEFMKYSNWRFLSCNQKLLSYDIGQIMENI